MSIPDSIQQRRSIRNYEGSEIPDETIDLLIEAACMAPSAGNRQPWEFIVIKDPETKSKIAEAAFDQWFISWASVAIIVCADPERTAEWYGNRGRYLYCIQDTAAAIQNLLLTATENGLGSCWIGSFDERRISNLFKLPENIRPLAIIPIGHPNERPPPNPSRPLEEVIHREKW